MPEVTISDTSATLLQQLCQGLQEHGENKTPVVLILFALGVYAAAEFCIERTFVSKSKRNPTRTARLPG